jgi:hypothetical protein
MRQQFACVSFRQERFVLSKPLWESAFWADFHQWRQFPQASFLSFCFFFFLCADPQFPQKKFALGAL